MSVRHLRRSRSHSPSHSHSRNRSRGVALIAVLWLVTLLTLLATTVATLSVSHRRAVQRHSEVLQLDTIADSAIRVAILRIIAPQSPNDAVAAGTSLTLRLPGGDAEVTIEREQGRIDLNTVDEELLFALLAANGWDEQPARDMVARIADWKDSDDEPRQGGAERSDYEKAGLLYGPRNGPFESVKELRQVRGAEDLSPTIFASLTVYTHARVPLAFVAPEPVKRALALADKRQLDGHRWLPESDDSTSGAISGAPSEARNLIGEVVRTRACARLEKLRRCRSTVARLTGSTLRPLQIFVWQTEHTGDDSSP